jgi:hypothetical protein
MDRWSIDSFNNNKKNHLRDLLGRLLVIVHHIATSATGDADLVEDLWVLYLLDGQRGSPNPPAAGIK